MSSRFRDLQEAALFLRNAAPEQWEAFLFQFSEMARRCTNDLVRVDQSAILTTQGAARQSIALFDALLTCDQKKPEPQEPAPLSPQ